MMKPELETMITTASIATADAMQIQSVAKQLLERSTRMEKELFTLRNQLEKYGGEDTKQKPLSEPRSQGYPPNKYRAFAQRLNSMLSENKHLSHYDDFVGIINEIEEFVEDLEKQGLLTIHEYMVPQD